MAIALPRTVLEEKNASLLINKRINDVSFCRQAQPLVEKSKKAIFEMVGITLSDSQQEKLHNVQMSLFIENLLREIGELEFEKDMDKRQDIEDLHKSEMSKEMQELLTFLITTQIISDRSYRLKEVIENDITEAYEKHILPLNERQYKKVVELGENLDKLGKVLDCVLESYESLHSGIPLQSQPSLEKLKDATVKLSRQKRAMKENELTELLNLFANYPVVTSREHLLGSILGFDGEFGDWFHDLDAETRNHQTDLYYACRYVEDREGILRSDNRVIEVTGVDTLIQALKAHGFMSRTAHRIAENIDKDLISLQLPSFWAIRHIKFVMHHHQLLGNAPRYPYNTDKVNEWIETQITCDDGDKITVNMVNIGREQEKCIESSRPRALKELDRECEATLTHEFLYHGTSHESASAILEEGITPGKGAEKQDFSDARCRGFYLSDSYDNAALWAGSPGGIGGSTGGAVIIYKVPREVLSSHTGLDFSDSNDRLSQSEKQSLWEKVVSQCRRNRGNRVKELTQASFVKGPACLNPSQLPDQLPQGFGDSINQICIRSAELGTKLGSHIHAVVFF